MDEIDATGKLVEISSFALPSSSKALPPRSVPIFPSTAGAEEPANIKGRDNDNPRRHGGGEEGGATIAATPPGTGGDGAGEECCTAGTWMEQLRRVAGDDAVERLAELDAAARLRAAIISSPFAVTTAAGEAGVAGLAAGATAAGGNSRDGNSSDICTPEGGEEAHASETTEVVGDSVSRDSGKAIIVGATNGLDTAALLADAESAAQGETRDNSSSSGSSGGGGSKQEGGTRGVLVAPTSGNEASVDGGAGFAVVRIPAGCGADKEARARVHRAVQETFPFVKVT